MKRDGLFVKKAKFFFENGQTMTIFVGDQGDVYQWTLNTTKQPIPSAKNEAQLAKEMTKLMDRNQKKFDKQQARKAAKALKDTSGTKPASRALGKRLEEAQSMLQVVQNDNALIVGLHGTKTQELSLAQDNVSKLESQLNAEKAETAELERQIQELNN
jgi:hypothetical protein